MDSHAQQGFACDIAALAEINRQQPPAGTAGILPFAFQHRLRRTRPLEYQLGLVAPELIPLGIAEIEMMVEPVRAEEPDRSFPFSIDGKLPGQVSLEHHCMLQAGRGNPAIRCCLKVDPSLRSCLAGGG